ncbi:TonB-dependent receptor [Mucilaginibacter arboris]|uniref:TonB-dependent siderophore receptor n=1 Tax=Mucilaginibacter arboris TaxID=2682090 RepID=A0A7K1SVV0_9SPHI|nr:TonB-dependent receptor [Mucilaginibacter arboris]MVN21367.1 TonB-dependent siderophore receptor [Mucilaginibacter arboris]
MIKKALLLLPLLFILIYADAQTLTGRISGKIKTSDGQPEHRVTITIKELNKIAFSREDGSYTFNNVKPGTYTLRVSCVGCSNKETTLTVVAEKTVIADFNLAESTSNLKEVNINANKNSNNIPVTLGKAAISPLDLPQSTGIVTSRTIEDQQVNRLGDALRNVSGVSLTQTRGGVSESFSARGYTIGIAGASGSIFRNGVLTNTAGFPDASTLESIEVLKGSSALLYGNTSGGLVINLVTKKPKFDFGGEVAMRYGSYNDYKPMVDVYGPISKNVAFRVIGSYENSGSYRDQVKTKITNFSPSLLFNLGPKTTLLVEGNYFKADLTPDNGVGTLNNGRFIPDVPRSQYINTNWAYSNLEQGTGSATLNHKFNDSWYLNAIGSVQGTSVNSFGSSLPNNVGADGTWNRGLTRAKTYEGDYTGQVNLNGKFKTGFLSHQLLVGTDFAEVLNVTRNFAINGITATNTVYDKINIVDLNEYPVRTDMPNSTDTLRTKSPSYRFGYYAQDLISITDKFKVLAGLRYSIVKTEQTSISNLKTGLDSRGTASTKIDKAFSPKVALIYQPVKTTSVYATYSNNFNTNSTYTDIYGATLKPSTVDQYEAGIKNDLFNGKLTANLSVYRITNSDLAIQAQFDSNGNPNTVSTVREFSGQTKSDGFDIDINGNISKNFYFVAGYGYNYIRYTKTTGSTGSYIVGERLVNSPANTFNGSLFYTFDLPALRGLKLGASAFYTGSRFGGYNNTVNQTQKYSRLIPLSGFTTVDLSAGYAYKRFSLLGKISNIGNTLNYLIHDNYSITPIPPRQFLTTLAYKF